MFTNHFRQFLGLCVLVGLLTAVTVLNTAVTAQMPQLPPAADERILLPHFPTGDEERDAGDSEQSLTMPSWSKGVFQSYRDGNWEIYSSQAPSRLTYDGSSDIHPRYNRGAARIVFSSNRDGDYEIFAMNADGSGLQQLTHNDTIDVNPAWSPNGNLIVFQAYRDGQAEVYVMNADGTNETRLTVHAAYDGDPVWSPDGSKIAFRSARLGTPFIYVMNSDGSGIYQLSGQPSYYVAWSPDGSQIAYTADLDGDDFFEMWLMNANGSNQRMIYDPIEPQADAWVRGWSPDGREITFTHIKFIQYQGNWYWEWAYIESYYVATGNVSSLDWTGREWHPDWQTTDIAPPQTEMEAMAPYSPISDFEVYWFGVDQDSGAGLATYDVQYKVGTSGSWVDWRMGVMETSAAYTAVPGTTVSFRARARDNAFNVEPWPTVGNPTTTFYTWTLGGKLTDNRGVPIPHAPLSINPLPINEARTDQEGNFFVWLQTVGSHTIDVIRSGYGDLAQTSLNMENLAHIYLPPANDILLNGGFEAAQPLANWTTVGPVTTLTDFYHTGTKSALLDHDSCPPPCNSITSISQQVTIPVNVPAPTLAFMVVSSGVLPEGSGLELLVSDEITTTAVPVNPGDGDWTHAWNDMSPWAGQTVTVTLKLTQPSGNPPVHLVLDDVTLGSAYPDTWVRGTGPGSALPGETVVLRLEYGNNGRVPAVDGELAISWPESLTFVSASVTPTVGVDTLTWNVGDLAAESEPVTIVVTATVDPSIAYFETIDLPVSLSSATSEVEQQNNEIVMTLLVAHRAFLPVIHKP